MIFKRNPCSHLRHRLTLQEETQTDDGYGGYIRLWKDVANLWAEIIPLDGREKLFADQVQAQVTHKIHLRYRDGITTVHRLVFEKRVFNIRYISNLFENNEILELLAEEGVAA